MLYRRSSSLILKIVKNEIYCYNFIQKAGMVLSNGDLKLIKNMDEWVEEEYFLSFFKDLGIKEIAKKIHQLAKKGVIVKEKSPVEEKDHHYKEYWKWGANAGFYHFSVRNITFISGGKTAELAKSLEEKSKIDPSPPTFHENVNVYAKVHMYDKPTFDEGIFNVMKRRRTVRSFDPDISISQEELMQSLFAGLGIVTFREAPPIGFLPLKMTPSGGARNPYDAYVYCLNVEGLEKGIYRYSPTEHSLGLVNSNNLPAPGTMLGTQKWIDNAAAVVFLVADINRTMWKYEHYSAYRVMLIEAGHIGQNIILATNQMGFYGSPTAAICDDIINKSFNDELSLFKSCVYAIALGHLGANKNLYAQ